MRIFDLHADLAMTIKAHRDNGEKAVLRNVWHDRFMEGELLYTAAASFFRGEEDWEYMQDLVRMVQTDIDESGIKQILTKEDLDENDLQVTALMTLEGMCGIDKDGVERVEWLYKAGNRIGSLCWNDQNALATGNWGDPGRGLTPMGKDVIRKMNDMHMIIDVSNANEKTFWDILETSEQPVIATHSNAKAKCFVERNLTDQQMRALAAKGGLIGMNACNSFIHRKEKKQDARHLAKHARYISNLVGVEHVACGFDFGAYYGADEHHDLVSPEQAQNFIRGLEAEGFSEDEIKDIAYRNVFRFLKQYM